MKTHCTTLEQEPPENTPQLAAAQAYLTLTFQHAKLCSRVLLKASKCFVQVAACETSTRVQDVCPYS